MTRRAFLLTLVGLAPAEAATEVSAETILRFHIPYDKFFRTYFGCSPTDREPHECESSRGIIDLKLLREVRQNAGIWRE